MSRKDVVHDRVETYRETVKQFLTEFAQHPPSNGQIEVQTIFDETRDHYQLVALGWQGKRRVHGCIVHIDLIRDKLWLQHDSTDAEIAEQLVERGIPKEQIVLGFQPESYRVDSGFAVG
jgi:hypothetical protein